MNLLDEKHINVDFVEKEIKSIRCSQYDKDSREYIVHFFDNGKKRLISSQEKVVLKLMKPDANPVVNYCTINEDGTVIFKLTEQICAVAGTAPFQFMLLDTNEKTIANTMPLKLIIEKGVFDNDTVTSSYEFDALLSILLEIEDIKDHLTELNTKVEINENERIKNENKRIEKEAQRDNAEEQRQLKEEERLNNESQRVLKENNRILAEENRIAKENERILNENSRIENERLRTDNENLRITKESDRKKSEEERILNETARIDAESHRKTEENIRIENENKRKTNESNRIDAENNRKIDFSDIQNSSNEMIASANKVISNANNSSINADKSAERANTAAKKCEDIISNNSIVLRSEKGQPNGIATLDDNGKIPSNQLPSYLDDVIEGIMSKDGQTFTDDNFEIVVPESGKIYIDINTNITYRWSGTIFSRIGSDLALGETMSTAYRGDRGKIAYEHSLSTHARTDATKVEKSVVNGNIKINGTETVVYNHPSGTNPHGTTAKDVGLGNVPNVATNDQIITYTKSTTLSDLVSSEKISVAFGKIAKAITDLISHIKDNVKHITVDERNKWDNASTHASSTHAPSNAEPNQNAFSNIVVGSTIISADSKTDSLSLVAGSNVSITTDGTNDKITISATDTKYTHPTTSGNKHIPSGGTTGQILEWFSNGTAKWGNYITYGSNENGQYYKFLDGTLICTKSVLIENYDVNIEWGSMYEGKTVSLGDFPYSFIEIPNIQITHSVGRSGFYELLTDSSTTHIGNTIICAPKSYINGTYGFFVQAIGRWKK